MNECVETLNRLGESFSSFAWPMLWQSSLLIAVIFAFDSMFARHVRASVRYALWMVVLVKLLLPPALALPTGATWWLWRPHPVVETPAIKNYTVSFDNSVTESLQPATVPVVESTPKLTGDAWALLAAAAMGLGLLSWLAFRWPRVVVKVRYAPTAPAELGGILEEARQLVGLRRRLRLKLIDDRQSPAVYGFFRPVILLPQTLAHQLTARQLRAVLLHEAMHLRRGDVWVNFAQTLLQITYWWHPLLWVANARIRRVREEAVDDAVMLALRDGADAYAPTLLEVAKFAFRRPRASLGLVGILESRSALRQRVERLVDFQPSRRTGLTILSLCGIFAFSAVALPMGQGPATNEPTASPGVAIGSVSIGLGVRPANGNGLVWQANSALDHALALRQEDVPLSRPKSAQSYITLTAQTNANPGRALSLAELDFIHLDQIGPFQHATLSVVIDKLCMKDSYIPVLTTSKLLNGSQTLVDMPGMTNAALSDVLEAIVSGANPPIKYSLLGRYIGFFPFPQPANLNDELFDPITGTKVDFNSPQYEMRTFKVDPKTFIPKLKSSVGYNGPSVGAKDVGKIMEQFFSKLGVTIVPPETVFFNDGLGVLFVYATPKDLDVIEKAVQVLNEAPLVFHVQAYQIGGENYLPPEKLSGMLTNYTGDVGWAEVSLAARKLQDIYRQAGYTNVQVVLPRQRLTNGIVHLKTIIVDYPPQIHIKARFIEVPQKFFSSAAAESLPPGMTNGGILTAAESKKVLRLLESQKGSEELAQPEAITLIGRQAIMQVTDFQPAFTNSSLPPPYLAPHISAFDTGSIFEVSPMALSGGYSLHMSVTAYQNVCFGFVGIKGMRTPVPAIQVNRASADVEIYDGQTVVLFPTLEQESVRVVADDKSQEKVTQYIRKARKKQGDKVIVVLATATLIDPAGNRVHSDYYDAPYNPPHGGPMQLP